MTQNQISFYNAQETKRHNLAQEALTGEQNAMTKTHYNMQDIAAQQNAESNAINAAANTRNAESNSLNSVTNARNASTNERNAEINAYNADINAYNAAINQQNANSNAINADANYLRAVTESEQSPSVIDRNEANARQSDSSTLLNTAQAIQKYPIGAVPAVTLFQGGSSLRDVVKDTLKTVDVNAVKSAGPTVVKAVNGAKAGLTAIGDLAVKVVEQFSTGKRR